MELDILPKLIDYFYFLDLELSVSTLFQMLYSEGPMFEKWF